ncbi:MAG: error-prone DNA polymerase [Rhodospirillaceae bacterium]|nr:error-prone DNA polymerase [Rhodospirillaceae bacterium]MBT5083240.1 error-prone DNA polymerase [Rhodospirillaceae bacterium]MBT5523461.1 error-prone DNA polymerase [Rhodospirillaceae bacterium]MBT5878568.1 error-prone DNA polymerase [Rhodospirillaceae bacterium]MBT6983384.1 error-prone DNA polymerase [Rhodospirillaceae bacterium]
MSYAELQVTSNFSFLRGGSHADELAISAAALGLTAIAITDRNSLAGVVRAHSAAKTAGIRLLVGARLDLQSGLSLLCFPTDRAAYGRLSQLLTTGRRRAPKGECWLELDDVLGHDEGQIFVVLPPAEPDQAFIEQLHRLGETWPGHCYLAGHYLYSGDDRRRLAHLAALAEAAATPLVATNDVHYHTPGRRILQDVLVCIREHCTLAEAGFHLNANAERHLKSGDEMTRLFADHPDAVARTVELADRCRFSLAELAYEYPADPVPKGRTAQEELARLTWAGAHERYGTVIDQEVIELLRHELELIGELEYAPYFLTVHDIVRFARERDILCQGRGSAANSAVCYCLGITAVDPARLDLLFERFISAERDEPPDIDVDFEHERREEVIQYVYEKYGRHRAGMTATVISYRSKSAIREVGKALGLSLDVVGALADNVWGWGGDEVEGDKVREIGLNPDDPTVAMAIRLARELKGFPRHLSQHVGGFVITRGPLSEVVPITNAAMADRTVIEWDKNDLDALGILKIDLLSLGMLTCIRKGLDLIAAHYGKRFSLATVPAEDPGVYDMLCRADSIGVFQVESRAQMTMLPRLRPRNFYDLVIEVAIVRPGPIQGDMVHPYLRRRSGKERVDFPSDDLRQVLGKTLGIPLFQEQAMRIAIVAAGFTPSEADRLRRAMATFRHTGTIHTFRQKMIEGMTARGYERDFAERCFKQIEGFGEYGFPESHAASFALLVYISAWMKHHYPSVFACALLNSQPMGFYAPAQIVRDAREHGAEVRPVDVNYSNWDCTLEDNGALRLGLRQIRRFREASADILMAARGGGYDSPEDLWRRTGLGAGGLETLADGDAWRSTGLDRRAALWALKRLNQPELPLFAAAQIRPPSIDAPREAEVALPDMPIGEQVVQDYSNLRLSLKDHPLRLLRPALDARGIIENEELLNLSAGNRVTVAGLVLVRQRPGTAQGVIFITIEDEGAVANIIVRPPVFEAYRRVVLSARLLGARGRVEREGMVIHVLAEELIDLSVELDRLREDPRIGGGVNSSAQPFARRGQGSHGGHPRNANPAAPIPQPRSFR